jgi:FixJ family two-component response regulator
MTKFSDAKKRQTVFIVERDVSFSKSLMRLVTAGGYDACAFDSSAPLEGFSRTTPGCILLSLQTVGHDSLAHQRELIEIHSPHAVIFLTTCEDIPATVNAMKAGAADVLVKPVAFGALMRAIENALDLSSRTLSSRTQADEIKQRASRLTPREREVLALVAKGCLNKQIAAQLGTVEKTVKVHRAHIMEKLEVESIADLIRLADKLSALRQLGPTRNDSPVQLQSEAVCA